MGKFIDLAGRRFGRLAIIEATGKRDGSGNVYWKCRCSCSEANDISVSGSSLRKGATRSCGCLQKEFATTLNKSHGMWRSPEYISWDSMIGRCTRPTSPRWTRYGGANPPVLVCDRWFYSFENFYADLGERPEGTTLGRFGDVGNYEPGNIKWMTPAEQAAEQKLKRQKKLEAVAA